MFIHDSPSRIHNAPATARPSFKLRGSNEHIPIVRVPQTGGQSGCPPLYPKKQPWGPVSISQPRRPRKLLNPWLWQYVRTHLAEGCWPEQIAGRLKRVYPTGMRLRRCTKP
jgi:hypothetical protein